MSTETLISAPPSRFQRISNLLLALCLGVMAVAVFINIVLRYGFGSGVPASEELSRLLFVWMVFIGATSAYPLGEHMAFTSLVGLLKNRPRLMLGMTMFLVPVDTPGVERAYHEHKMGQRASQVGGFVFTDVRLPADAVLGAESLQRPYPHLHAAHEWLVAHQPADEPLALSWGDAKLGNVVYADDGRVAGALDWEQATLASPVDDLAWWLMLDQSTSTGYGVPRLAGLPTREETIEHWERASGFSARHLPYYDVFAAWRMAYVMARIGTVFMERGLVPRESEMDLRNGGAALLAMHAARLGF